MPIINGQLLETIDITQNGRYDIAKYTSANVNVKGGGDVNIESLNITPSTSEQTINPTSEIDGYAPIHVSAVTSSIDSDIKPENIKSGVNILGVTGNYVGESKGYLIDSEGNFVNILQNYLDEGRINPIDLKEIVHINKYGFNYLYDNFRDRNSLALGKPPRVDLRNLETINGFYACKNAFSNNSTYWAGKHHGVGDVDMHNLTTISGEGACETMFENSHFTSIDLSSLTTINGAYACQYMFRNSAYAYIEPEPVESDSSESESFNNNEVNENINWEDWEREYRLLENPEIIDFPSLTTIKGYNACQGMFEGFRMMNDSWGTIPNSCLSFSALETISNDTRGAFDNAFVDFDGEFIEFPKLKTIESTNTFIQAFEGSYELYEVRFPSLETINGGYNFAYAFKDTTGDGNFVEMRFPSLKEIRGGYSNFRGAFYNCTCLRDIYFNSLNYIGSNTDFEDMLEGCTDVIIHFPENLNPSIISSLKTYPDFGGTNTTILFDL